MRERQPQLVPFRQADAIDSRERPMTTEMTARLKVFISYARSDGSALADELVTALEVAGFEGYLDRHDISAGEDWEQRLGTLIRQADTVVFLITPSAVASERCT